VFIVIASQSLKPVEKMILSLLSSSSRPMSTYEIAKQLSLSWATVNFYCNKLRWNGLLHAEVLTSKTGSRKVIWSTRPIKKGGKK